MSETPATGWHERLWLFGFQNYRFCHFELLRETMKSRRKTFLKLRWLEFFPRSRSFKLWKIYLSIGSRREYRCYIQSCITTTSRSLITLARRLGRRSETKSTLIVFLSLMFTDRLAFNASKWPCTKFVIQLYNSYLGSWQPLEVREML